jgi:hypothetical protein
VSYPEKQRKRTAVHEAGHAAAAYLRGYPIDEGWVAELWRLDMPGNVVGYIASAWIPQTADEVDDAIVLCLAGGAAAGLAMTGDAASGWELSGCRADIAEARHLAPLLTGGEDPDARLERLKDETVRLASTPIFQRLVEMLAPKLLGRRLDGRELTRILREAIPPWWMG